MVTTFAEAAEVVRGTVMKKYPQISRAFIFGSFAEDTQAAGSDLDVLVELGAPMGLTFIAMIQDLEKATGTPVDVITTKQAQDLESKFSYEIIRKARIVYDRSQS